MTQELNRRKTANARLQQRIYAKAKMLAFNALLDDPETKARFDAYRVQFQSDLEYEAGYIPASRGGRRLV